MSTRSLMLLALVWFTSAISVRADDWPQWRGVHRDGISKETGLLKTWPKDGPKLAWKNAEVGGGYSTPSIVGDRVYLLGDKDGQEYLIALDAKEGKEQWRTKVGKVGVNKGPQYPGTRSTPTVDGDCIYALGSDGDLASVDLAKGDIKWKKNLQTDFAGKAGQWAYAESPLIDGDVLVCTPGGKEATLAALNKKTGETVWKANVPEGDAAGYGSVIAVDAAGTRQYLQFLANGVVGVDAKSGKYLWRYNKTKDQAATIPTPIFRDDCVFTSTSRNGSGLVRIKPSAAEEVYFNKTALNSIGTPVLVGDYLYATDAGGNLVCMEFKTGEVKWTNPSVGTASLCVADGLLYVRGQGGNGFTPEKGPIFVAIVEPTPDGYKERGRFQQPDHGNKPAWPHPVVANGRLYLRDQGVLLCYDVKDAASEKK
jgi:outer membrane protein assembly factor BamB